MKIRFFLLLPLALAGCAEHAEIDGKVVADDWGNVYHIEWNLGNNYRVKPLPLKRQIDCQ